MPPIAPNLAPAFKPPLRLFVTSANPAKGPPLTPAFVAPGRPFAPLTSPSRKSFNCIPLTIGPRIACCAVTAARPLVLPTPPPPRVIILNAALLAPATKFHIAVVVALTASTNPVSNVPEINLPKGPVLNPAAMNCIKLLNIPGISLVHIK